MRTRKQMQELIGTKYGYLTIVELSEPKITEKQKYTMWKCQCICGNFKDVAHGDLMKKNRIKSCGCKTKETTLIAIDESNKARYKKMGCTSTEHNFYSQYRFSDTVRSRKLEFNLTMPEFVKITNSNCYYCGIKPQSMRFSHSKSESQLLNGIDRKDSSIGYTIENVVPCCIHCNRAKMDRNIDDFINWVKLIYQNLHAKEFWQND